MPLDEADLAVVERAEKAMRAWTPDALAAGRGQPAGAEAEGTE